MKTQPKIITLFCQRACGGLIIGKSGCEKTTLLLNLLLQPNWLDQGSPTFVEQRATSLAYLHGAFHCGLIVAFGRLWLFIC